MRFPLFHFQKYSEDVRFPLVKIEPFELQSKRNRGGNSARWHCESVWNVAVDSNLYDEVCVAWSL